MGQFVYPDSWKELAVAPSARAEFISFVRDVVQWNEKNSCIKTHGSDDLLGLFYDSYNVDQGAQHLVGQVLFPDEEEVFGAFFQWFDCFIREWENTQGRLSRLHEATLPPRVIQEAEKLLRKLEERGISEWQD